MFLTRQAVEDYDPRVSWSTIHNLYIVCSSTNGMVVNIVLSFKDKINYDISNHFLVADTLYVLLFYLKLRVVHLNNLKYIFLQKRLFHKIISKSVDTL